jgi:hypothetical protein
MRGIAFAFVAITFVATTPLPVAAQCYGPECDRHRSGPPPSYDERSNFHSNPANNGPLYRSVPYDQGQRHQGRPYQAHPYQGQQYQGQPNQGQPYHPAPHCQPAYQRPGYQAQPRPPMGYSNVPLGMAPGTPPGAAPHGYHPARPDGRTEVRTQVTKIPKAKRSAVRQHQSAPNNRTVTRHASPTAGAGQVTISVAEYRDLQNQARELQRLRGARSGPPNWGAPFPDVPPPAPGNQPGPSSGF